MKIEDAILGYLMANYDWNKTTKSKKIEQHFGITGKEIREVVNTLRRNAEPIASSKDGYWYTDDPEELQATIDNFDKRILGMINAREGLKIAKINLIREKAG